MEIILVFVLLVIVFAVIVVIPILTVGIIVMLALKKKPRFILKFAFVVIGIFFVISFGIFIKDRYYLEDGSYTNGDMLNIIYSKDNSFGFSAYCYDYNNDGIIVKDGQFEEKSSMEIIKSNTFSYKAIKQGECDIVLEVDHYGLHHINNTDYFLYHITIDENNNISYKKTTAEGILFPYSEKRGSDIYTFDGSSYHDISVSAESFINTLSESIKSFGICQESISEDFLCNYPSVSITNLTRINGTTYYFIDKYLYMYSYKCDSSDSLIMPQNENWTKIELKSEDSAKKLMETVQYKSDNTYDIVYTDQKNHPFIISWYNWDYYDQSSYKEVYKTSITNSFYDGKNFVFVKGVSVKSEGDTHWVIHKYYNDNIESAELLTITAKEYRDYLGDKNYNIECKSRDIELIGLNIKDYFIFDDIYTINDIEYKNIYNSIDIANIIDNVFGEISECSPEDFEGLNRICIKYKRENRGEKFEFCYDENHIYYENKGKYMVITVDDCCKFSEYFNKLYDEKIFRIKNYSRKISGDKIHFVFRERKSLGRQIYSSSSSSS